MRKVTVCTRDRSEEEIGQHYVCEDEMSVQVSHGPPEARQQRWQVSPTAFQKMGIELKQGEESLDNDTWRVKGARS